MAIRKYKPTTNGRRNMSVLTYEEITTDKPEKSLLVPLNKKAGRNAQGVITVRHKGGAEKRKYRVIDFKRNKDNIPAVVKTIEYDPNRSANIALLAYADGEKRYILAPQDLKVGQTVMSGENVDITVGNTLPIGVVGNLDYSLVNVGKAGRTRHMGIRPTVRGSVMNPNDHPHGGGEGRQPVGRKAPMTPWGKIALGLKTRKTKNKTNRLIVRRRNDK